MASSEVEICNLAIAHLGQGKAIPSLDDRSSEAVACNMFYDDARDKALRDFDWNFARKIATLDLIESDPNTEWGYSYQYPTDCMEFRRILSGTRNDSRQSRIKYLLGNDGNNRKVIFSDLPDAVGQYTLRVEDPTRYPADFTMAFSFLLAKYLASRINAGNASKLRADMHQLYMMEVNSAMANSGNEEYPDEELEAETIRDGWGS